MVVNTAHFMVAMGSCALHALHLHKSAAVEREADHSPVYGAYHGTMVMGAESQAHVSQFLFLSAGLF